MLPYANLVSFRQPDHISLWTIDGTDYLLAANEGRTTAFNHAGEVLDDSMRGIDAVNGQ